MTSQGVLSGGARMCERKERISRAWQRGVDLKCPPWGTQKGGKEEGRVSPFSDIIQDQSESSFSRLFLFQRVPTYFRSNSISRSKH